ncbi:MAG: hypothetical protein RL490_623, partial [Pseudomonadota bacterium]
MLFRVLLALFMALASATPAAAAWRMAETAHFRLYGEVSEGSLRERARLLEDFNLLLRRLTNGGAEAEDAPKLDIFLVDDAGDAMPFGKVAAQVGGFYAASAGRIAAFSETGDNGQFILLHEYVHHFMLSRTRLSYPAWYVEGFAEYFSTAKFTSRDIEVGGVSTGRAMQLARGTWLPLTRLLARDPKL